MSPQSWASSYMFDKAAKRIRAGPLIFIVQSPPATFLFIHYQSFFSKFALQVG